MVLLMSSICFSQKLVKSNSGDSSICFSIDQCRILLKQLNRVSYLDSLNNLNESTINAYKEAVLTLNKLILEKDHQIGIKQEEISAFKIEVNNQKENVSSLKKELAREKIKKWISISVGTLTTGFMTYLWITK